MESYNIINETFEDFELPDTEKDFLISSLPMSYDVQILKDIYLKGISDNTTDVNCAIHDIALYEIKEGLKEEIFLNNLKYSFFNHPFIKIFLLEIEHCNNEIYFGRAKEWIQNNTSTVPTPRRWELTNNTQILYKWIVDLSDGLYLIDIPSSHSQRLYKNIN